MRLFIKEYRSSENEEVVLLLDSNGIPLLLPNRFVFSAYRLRGLSSQTIKHALRAISLAHRWAFLNGLNFDKLVFDHVELQPHQADDLADFLSYSAHARALIAEGRLAVYGRSQTKASKETIYIGDQEYANRLRFVARYVEWMLEERAQQRANTNERSIATIRLAINVLRRRAPRLAPKHVNEKLEAVDECIVEKIALTLHPDSPLTSSP